MDVSNFNLLSVGCMALGPVVLLFADSTISDTHSRDFESFRDHGRAGQDLRSEFFELEGAVSVGDMTAVDDTTDYAKRALDVAVATLLAIVLATLMLLIALLIWIDSRGPILFRQRRAGRGGRPFTMYKFRTMYTDAEAEKRSMHHLNASGDPRLFKIPNDPRVTRIGLLLRRSSLDELPQLWNVIRGDMSLVGPRPFFVEDLDKYATHHFRRLEVRPGLTGLWQVNGRSGVRDFEEVVRLDTQYVDNRSIWLDTRILLRTIPTVLRRDGAY